ncbi:MAG: Holliday junction branch migration DNA helicase RuvB, partial [Candidatus Portnoybacteria bacterium CG10_big_fil_rev_8_21_14_0_10_44_7]
MEKNTDPKQKDEDKVLDITLRPRSLSEYQGQEQIKQNLQILIDAARQRREPIEHILLCGAAGLGKTTLSHVIAREMGVGVRVTSGPAVERSGDLASILTNLGEGEILFIDECHRLNKTIEEVLYPAMEDFKIDIIIGKGPSARTLELELPKFTLIAATTRIGLLSSPLRSRFGVTFRLDFYQDREIERIIKRSAKILSVPIDSAAITFLARCARRTPRVANRLLKRARDLAQVKN